MPTRTISRASSATSLTLLALLVPSIAVMAQTTRESVALRQRVQAYQNAWNTHDPTTLAIFFTEDADVVMGNLPAVQGRQKIQDLWQDYFARQEPERRLTLDISSVKIIAADVAVVNVATTTGGHDRKGQELPARRFRGTWLLRRLGGEWLIAALWGLPSEEDRVELRPSLETAESLRPQLRAFVDAYEDTFDRHDPEALSAFYRDDADIIIREGPVIRGAQAIREWWRVYFSQPRPYRALLIIEDIKMMSDNVALLNGTATGAWLKATQPLSPVRQARWSWVVVREDGAWLISALRVLPSEDDRVIRASGR